jgi:uncharacterized damage-inducible protein DinB
MLRTRTLALCATLALAAALPLRADHHEAVAGALSDADRASLVAMLEEGLAETDALVAKAEGDLFTRKPGPDRWSVAEVLEHIGTTEGALFGMLEAALATPADPEAAQITAGQPIDGFTTFITDRSRRFQAPAEMAPKGGMTREQLVERYHAARAKTLDFVRTTQAPVASHTAQSPAGKMTGHHLLALIAAHNLRHNKQIAEALAQLQAAPAEAAEADATRSR